MWTSTTFFRLPRDLFGIICGQELFLDPVQPQERENE